MKLSEMSTDTAREVLCNLAVPLSALADNPAVDEFYAKYRAEEITPATAIKLICRLMPVLLRDNAAETYAVLSALTEKPVKAIQKQPIADTIRDAKSVFDREFFDFFRSLKGTEQAE